MRIVHVSYSVDGGAGKSALRLHENLLNLNVDSLIFAFDQGITLPPTLPAGPVDRFLARYMKNIDKLPNKLTRHRVTTSWSNNWAPNQTLRKVIALNPDIVHMHFIGAGTFPISDFPAIPCPVVWTLHDMLAFTGGCHYTGRCERFREKCGRCPILRSNREEDLSRSNWTRKKHAWDGMEISVVSPSNWLADEARRSSLFSSQQVTVIPYGIDLGRFRPLEKREARKEFGISDDKFVVAFGAARLTDERKGLDLLWEALQIFQKRSSPRNLELLVFGGGDWTPSGASIPIHNAGMINDELRLARLYSAADVFCAPSREENLANTCLESLACGTPVLSFAIGGFPDIIDHRVTGYLADAFKPDSLSDGIDFIHSVHLSGKSLTSACRARAEKLFDGKTNARHYVDLYEALAGHKPGMASAQSTR